jgi:hypothetical protein
LKRKSQKRFKTLNRRRNHSHRKAIIGFTFVARRAGMKHTRCATIAGNSAMAT